VAGFDQQTRPFLVLATSPVPLSQRYGKFAGAASTEPSFGLVCLAAAAEKAGAKVALVEASARNMSVEQAARAILGMSPDIVGISATTAGIAAAGELAARLKKQMPSVTTLAGGCHATALPARTLEEFPAFDMAVVGEGEDTLLEIIESFRETGSVGQRIPGTALRKAGGVLANPPRPYILDMDRLPMPAWHLIDGFPRSFRPSPARVKRWPCASVVLSRGCPNRCTFCDRSVFGDVCRSYSPEYAVRMIEDLKSRYGVREVLVEDDTFVIRRETVREFCRLLIERRARISWSCLGRANLVDPELLSLMRKAGCWHISYGIESGDPGILRSVNKNLDLAQVQRALLWSREAGLRTKGFFMVGFPGETEATLEATRRAAGTLPMDDISVMQLTPFPGSAIYESALKFGRFDMDWRKMNTLNTVFLPNGLSEARLKKATADTLRAFYSRPDVLIRLAFHAAGNPRLALFLARGLGSLLRVTASRTDA
jgi:radical SAM superfamily enzyme YgiQ (UPF0313 family)